MLMYTAPPRRAGVGALFRVHKNGTEPGPRPDLRSEMLIRGARGPIDFGWCCAVPRRAAVPAHWRVARDDAFASDHDFWVYEHLQVVNFLPVHTSRALLVDRVRRYIPAVCLFVS